MYITSVRLALIAASLIMAFTITCGKENPTEPKPPPPLVVPVTTRIVITPSSATLNSVGQTVQLTARVFDQNNNPINGVSVMWTSNDLKIVTVSTMGLLTAVKNGAAVVTARSANVSTTANITVSQSADSIVIEPQMATLSSIGEILQLTATVRDKNEQLVTDVVVTWTSSDYSVATVSTQGLVTAVNHGNSRITAKVGSVFESIVVIVKFPNPDRNALIALYNQTDGRNWLNNNNWLTEMPLNEWHGVGTDITGRVVSLSLSQNNLSGMLPSEMGQLDKLVYVELGSNRLIGSIPKEIGKLANLRELYLTDNQITDMPSELARLTNLRNLNLQQNQLSGKIPIWLGQLNEIERLSLNINNLNGPIPQELRQLTKLRDLNLQRNKLSGVIPPWLGQLKDLRSVYLNHNRLTGKIPSELGDLSNLDSVYLNHNRLTGKIPSELGDLSNLDVLYLGNNELNGTIPSELGRMTNLGILGLEHNELTGSIPPEIGLLSSLVWLMLSGNENMTGVLPREITNLRLEMLRLDGTQLCVPQDSGFQEWLLTIPNRRIVNCVKIEEEVLITLYNETEGKNWIKSLNWLSDRPLGEWFGVSTDLYGWVTEINLESNGLSGPIPPELGSLTHLRKLILSDNFDLSGPIHRELTRLDLESLLLDGTQMCAILDPEIQDWIDGILDISVESCQGNSPDWEALVALYYSTNGQNWKNKENWLTDSPLDEWHGVTANDEGRVTELHLHDNNLTGTIPPELGMLTELERLVLAVNDITGPIPPELGQLHKIRELNLGDFAVNVGSLSHGNRLTGMIPTELGHILRLETLSLAGNKLSGPIPSELGNLNRLENLILHKNYLNEIPSEIGDLKSLQVLSLGENKFTEVPTEIGRLRDLRRLNLQNNLLTNLPPEIGQLDKIQTLVLSANHLTELPPEIGSLQTLSDLYLSSNQLSRFPTQIGNLIRLRNLYLNSNLLTELPPEIGQLKSLFDLELNENKLTHLPPDIGNLNSLTRLYVSNNDLQGSMPLELSQLTNLATLDLSDNNLTGSIPPELGQVVTLKQVYLRNNVGMSGALPLTLTNLMLEAINLGGTNLCAPKNVDFQTWLGSIPNARVANCVSSMKSSVYLTQTTQSFIHPVPLIAGETALMRVFIINEQSSDFPFPPIKATFYQSDELVHTANISDQMATIQKEIKEGDLQTSANMEIPGSVISPGLEMVVEIDPDRSLGTESSLEMRIPETGKFQLDVRAIPDLELTLVPFIWSDFPDKSVLTDTETLTSEHGLFRQTRDLLPIRDFHLTVHNPVWTSVEPIWANRWEILGEVAVIQTMDGATGYYMGVINGGGLASQPGTVSVAGLQGPTIAHELGHNLSLGHAPCGNPSGTDRYYPYGDGTIGSWGYDFQSSMLVDPSTPDLMSYCDPEWISDYNFTKAFNHRLRTEQSRPMVQPPRARSLLIWGGVNEGGGLFLEPSFVVDASPTLHQNTGLYQLNGEADDGSVLFTFSFGMAEVADGEGGMFTFILPTRPDWSNKLWRITITGPEGVVHMTRDDGRSAAFLLSRSTGKIRGILRNWPEPGALLQAARRVLPEPGLDVVISSGIPDSADWDW